MYIAYLILFSILFWMLNLTFNATQIVSTIKQRYFNAMINHNLYLSQLLEIKKKEKVKLILFLDSSCLLQQLRIPYKFISKKIINIFSFPFTCCFFILSKAQEISSFHFLFCFFIFHCLMLRELYKYLFQCALRNLKGF